MYVSHPLFNDPEHPSRIWRYFDFTKFVSLIEKNALFCSRADKFKDPFEGSWTMKDYQYRQHQRVVALKHQNPEVTDEEITKVLRQDSAYFKGIKKTILINSWHYNESESAGMWRLFLKSNEGIAIQSTPERLKESVHPASEKVYIGKVNYINYETDQFYYPYQDLFVPYIHKRKSFEHEREYRAIISLENSITWDEEETLYGKYIPIDLDILIERIYVSPGTPDWYYELIYNILKKYGINKEVVPSVLNKRPLF